MTVKKNGLNTSSSNLEISRHLPGEIDVKFQYSISNVARLNRAHHKKYIMEAISTVFRRSPGKTRIKFCINNQVNYGTQNAKANKTVNVRRLRFSLQEVTTLENEGKNFVSNCCEPIAH